MAPRRIHPKKLLVEGTTEQFLIPELMEKNGVDPWEDPVSKERAVEIKPFDGISNLLSPGRIETELKESGLKIIGVVVDADENSTAKWMSLRHRCLTAFPRLPEELPADGIIEENAAGLRFGAWVMPDNRLGGMLETFLTFLVPDGAEPLMEYAGEVCKEAKDRGATYKEPHLAKAKIHTWLAWRDEPGRQLNYAVKEHVLNPTSPHAQPFVRWFRDLFQV